MKGIAKAEHLLAQPFHLRKKEKKGRRQSKAASAKKKAGDGGKPAAEASCGKEEKAAREYIIKPEGDVKDYRFLELENGLRCLLISNPTVVSTIASLDVRVGSALDPKAYYGLAHLLEIMLFNNDEAHVEDEAGARCGYSAVTGFVNTNYCYEMPPGGCQEGLSRLARFFTNPRFRKQDIAKKLEQVEKQFRRRLADDHSHSRNLQQRHADPKSSYHRFSCGSKRSLS